jgi:hypothetical protein
VLFYGITRGFFTALEAKKEDGRARFFELRTKKEGKPDEGFW